LKKSWKNEVSKIKIQKNVDQNDNGKIIHEYESEQPIPLLEDVLNLFKGKNFVFNIELKCAKPVWSQRHLGTEVAKIIRKTGFENQCIITSFDFFKLRFVELEYPGLHNGFTYCDEMSENLGTSNTWFENDPELALDKPAKFETNTHFIHWVMESNVIGNLIGSTVVGIEYTVFDDETIEKFHQKGMAVGTFTLLTTDTVFTLKPLNEQESINVIKHLFLHHVDWIETDDCATLKKILEQIKKKNINFIN